MIQLPTLTTKDMERVRRLAPLDSDVILMGGSSVEGFANAQSDIDILVIYEGPTDPDRPNERLYPAEETGRRIQVLACSEERIAELHEVITATARSTGMLATPAAFEDDGLMWYYRVAGTPFVISDPAGRWSAFAAGLSSADFGRAYARHCTHLALKAWAAATSPGQRHSSVAALLLQEAVLWSAESFMALSGEPYPRLKWIFAKAARRYGVDSPFYETLWDAKAIGPRSLREYEDCVTHFLEFAGIDPHEVERYVEPPTLQHAPGTRLFEIDGTCYVVRDKLHMFALPPQALTLWRSFATPTTEVAVIETVEASQRALAASLIAELIARSLLVAE